MALSVMKPEHLGSSSAGAGSLKAEEGRLPDLAVLRCRSWVQESDMLVGTG